MNLLTKALFYQSDPINVNDFLVLLQRMSETGLRRLRNDAFATSNYIDNMLNFLYPLIDKSSPKLMEILLSILEDFFKQSCKFELFGPTVVNFIDYKVEVLDKESMAAALDCLHAICLTASNTSNLVFVGHCKFLQEVSKLINIFGSEYDMQLKIMRLGAVLSAEVTALPVIC